MEKRLKSWQGWLLFAGTMAVVFVLGMLASSVTEKDIKELQEAGYLTADVAQRLPAKKQVIPVL